MVTSQLALRQPLGVSNAFCLEELATNDVVHYEEKPSLLVGECETFSWKGQLAGSIDS